MPPGRVSALVTVQLPAIGRAAQVAALLWGGFCRCAKVLERAQYYVQRCFSRATFFFWDLRGQTMASRDA